MPVRSIFPVALTALFLAGPAADAASTFRIQGEFSGGQLGVVTYDVVVSGNFDTTILSASVDSVTITSTALGGVVPRGTFDGIGYSFGSPLPSSLVIGGLQGGGEQIINPLETDFRLSIVGFPSSSPRIEQSIIDTIATMSGFGLPVSDSFSVTELSPIPLPLPAALLLTGLGALALRGARRA